MIAAIRVAAIRVAGERAPVVGGAWEVAACGWRGEAGEMCVRDRAALQMVHLGR